MADIARRYEISRGLLWTGAAKCAGACSAPPVFLPVQTVSQPPNGDGVGHVGPPATRGTEPVTDGKIEMTLPDGKSIKVGHNVGLVTLRRVMTVLRR